jgi:DNA repair exonuclease SbcCD ATPase subunit
VNERKDLVRFARRARARQGLVRAVDVGLRTAFYALCAALAALISAKVFGFTIPVRESVIGFCAVIAVAGLLALFFPRKGLLETAAEVDLRAGWKERLSSALSLSELTHPMEHALVDDVREKLKQHQPSGLFPLRAPWELRLAPVVAVVIAVVANLVPQMDVLGLISRASEKEKDKKEVASALEKLMDKRKKELDKNERLSDKVKDAIKKIDALAAELQKNPPPDRKEALAQISKLSDQLKQLKDELAKGAALAEKLQKAAAEKGSDSGELGKLIREGKFQEAVQELAKMRNALQEGKLTPAEREKLRKQMEALAEKLANKDKDLNEFEKKLAQAMKGLNDGNEKDLDGLQKQLGQLEADLNEKEQLAEALKDLENLSDALAKGEGECPSCNKKHKDGKG